MMNERWVTAAFTTDELVADLLLRLKQSPETTHTASISHPLGWGDRKSRSKGQQQRSPSTPLSWSGGASGGGGSSTSDGCDESSRPADLFSGDRSVKIDVVKMSCKAQSDIEIQKRRFVLPDLNETPVCEDFVDL
ncbi:uncharacterized protein [Rutidosis leptorrhynchoides]|uniref:uncharacterized protein n=1 Tax=Rutidosis leptorrhynchoides TaxID=125765 RepID=UPI003A9956C5